MFIVYSPEAQSAIGAAQILPQLKVDPSKRVLPVGESSLDELHTDVEHADKDGKGASGLDAYKKVMQGGDRPVIARVKELMSQPVITIPLESTIEQAWLLMTEKKVHHLPVVDEQGALMGLVSANDILMRTIVGPNNELEEVRVNWVADVMQREVIVTQPSTDVRRLAAVMTQYHLGCMPIMSDAQKLVGMVTLSDIVRRLSQMPPLTLYA